MGVAGIAGGVAGVGRVGVGWGVLRILGSWWRWRLSSWWSSSTASTASIAWLLTETRKVIIVIVLLVFLLRSPEWRSGGCSVIVSNLGGGGWVRGHRGCGHLVNCGSPDRLLVSGVIRDRSSIILSYWICWWRDLDLDLGLGSGWFSQTEQIG